MNPLAALDAACTKAAAQAEAQGVRNKLTQRDKTHMCIAVKRAAHKRERVTEEDLAELVNESRQGKRRVSTSTISRHLGEAGLETNVSRATWPQKLDVAKWLRKRRGFCKIMKSCDKSNICMADEAFFGLARKIRKHELTVHPIGCVPQLKQEAVGADKRVTVWAAIGLDAWTPLEVWEDGHVLNQEKYGPMLDSTALPVLMAACPALHMWEDNATFHLTDNIHNIYTHFGAKHSNYPSHSPDLNWIEKSWANLAERVYAGGRRVYEDKQQLTDALKAEWVAMASDADYRRRLVAQAEEAYRQCLRDEGRYVHWL